MIVIGSKVFAIVPNDDPVANFMKEFDPDHVELMHYDTMVEVHQTTTTWWGISLDCAISMYSKDNGNDVRWVCPD